MRTGTRVLAGLAAVVLTVAGVGCSSGDDGSPGPDVERTASTGVTSEVIELTEGDGCGEAFFWAATPDGDTAVIASVRANHRSKTEPTTIPVAVPDELVTVQVLRGTDLPRNFCTDLILQAASPESQDDATAGAGEIVLAPRHETGNYGCGSSDRSPNGTLRLSGVTAADGTEFAPIEVETSNIGCYSG